MITSKITITNHGPQQNCHAPVLTTGGLSGTLRPYLLARHRAVPEDAVVGKVACVRVGERIFSSCKTPSRQAVRRSLGGQEPQLKKSGRFAIKVILVSVRPVLTHLSVGNGRKSESGIRGEGTFTIGEGTGDGRGHPHAGPGAASPAERRRDPDRRQERGVPARVFQRACAGRNKRHRGVADDAAH